MEINSPTIIFMRHGERGDEVFPQIASELTFDPILTEKGKKQVREAAKYIKESLLKNQTSNIEIYSSPLIRCVESSSILMDEFHFNNKSILITNYVMEYLSTEYFPIDPIKNCLIRIKPKNEIVHNFTKNIDFIDDKNHEILKYPENINECCSRFYQCYDYFTNRAITTQKICIFACHGSAFDFIPPYFEQTPAHFIKPCYAAISMIQFDGESWKVKLSGYQAWK